MTFGGEFMATLRYKNPTTQKWELVGVSGGGGGSTGESQVVFSKLADFPAVGESDKIYIDTIQVNLIFSLIMIISLLVMDIVQLIGV